MGASHFQLLSAADRLFNSCGRPVTPEGRFVDIPAWYVYNQAIPSGAVMSAEHQLVDTEGAPVFMLRAIEVSGATGSVAGTGEPSIIGRFQTPVSFRFTSQIREFLNQTFNVGFGQRWVLDRSFPCPPNSRVNIELQNQNVGGNPIGVTIIFTGAHRYFFRGRGDDWEAPLKATPRFIKSANQNILLPEWMKGGACKWDTPPGYRDGFFRFTQTQNLSAGFEIDDQSMPIFANSSFIWRTLDYIENPTAGGGTGGTTAIRIRDTCGEMIMDDWVPANLISQFGGIYTPLEFSPGDNVLIDWRVLDGVGVGTATGQLIFNGLRRSRL